MSNVPKTHNNASVRRLLDGYYCAAELCEEHPAIDDIFSGVLALKSPGDSSTRALSRRVLFHILQRCSALDVASIHDATMGHYAYRTLARYAEVARVASKALEGYIDRLPKEAPGEFPPDAENRPGPYLTIAEERAAIDAPYADELAAAVAVSVPWTKATTQDSEAVPDSSTGLTLLKRFALAKLVEA